METDKTQLESTDHLRNRAGEVYRWKIELEHLILDITKEIELLEAEYRRVKHSLSVLTVPEAIAGEFLQLRSKRLESDLIRDEVEEELTKVSITLYQYSSITNLRYVVKRVT